MKLYQNYSYLNLLIKITKKLMTPSGIINFILIYNFYPGEGTLPIERPVQTWLSIKHAVPDYAPCRVQIRSANGM